MTIMEKIDKINSATSPQAIINKVSGICSMKKNEMSFAYQLFRQLVVSLALSGIVIIVSYNQTKNIRICVKKISDSLLEPSVLAVIIVFLILYIITKIASKYSYIISRDGLIFYVIKKIASNVESAFQLYTGVMIFIVPAWYYFERTTFNLALSVVYLLIAFGCLFFSTFYEITDTEL